jgi:nucleoside-diphosphate-sugar epimerase
VALLCPDLLFGSKLSSALTEAGHEVVGADEGADALVVDLTDDVDGRLRAAAGAGVPTLAFYAHVEQDVRRRAEAAGIDRVVPRSRMAREASRLVEALLLAAGREGDDS